MYVNYYRVYDNKCNSHNDSITEEIQWDRQLLSLLVDI